MINQQQASSKSLPVDWLGIAVHLHCTHKATTDPLTVQIAELSCDTWGYVLYVLCYKIYFLLICGGLGGMSAYFITHFFRKYSAV